MGYLQKELLELETKEKKKSQNQPNAESQIEELQENRVPGLTPNKTLK